MNILRRLRFLLFFKFIKDKDIKQKIDDILDQITYLQSCNMHTVNAIGAPQLETPKDLIDFQWKRIYTLKKATNQSKSEIMKDIKSYYSTMCGECKGFYDKNLTIATPCNKDYQDYCQLTLLYEIMRDGNR